MTASVSVMFIVVFNNLRGAEVKCNCEIPKIAPTTSFDYSAVFATLQSSGIVVDLSQCSFLLAISFRHDSVELEIPSCWGQHTS